MKKKAFQTGHLQLVGAMAFILLSIFLYSSTESLKKTLDTGIVNDVRSDVVRMRLYEGVTFSEFEGKNTLSYSFRIPENASVVTALSGKLLAVTQNTKVLGRVSFSFEGGRGYSEEEYIKNVLLKDQKIAGVTSMQTVADRSYFAVRTEGDVYYISRIDSGNWIVVFQGEEKHEEDLKQIVATFDAHP